MRNSKWTDEEFINAVKTSFSRRELAEKLGLKIPGCYNTIKVNIKRLNLDTSHFIKAPNNKPRAHYSFDELFCIGSKAHQTIRKNYITKNKLINYVCAVCGLGNQYNSKSLTLTLDHINGDRQDNRLENLRFVCPNCHSQTDNYASKNIKVG